MKMQQQLQQLRPQQFSLKDLSRMMRSRNKVNGNTSTATDSRTQSGPTEMNARESITSGPRLLHRARGGLHRSPVSALQVQIRGSILVLVVIPVVFDIILIPVFVVVPVLIVVAVLVLGSMSIS